jgi:hypothetical protein
VWSGGRRYEARCNNDKDRFKKQVVYKTSSYVTCPEEFGTDKYMRYCKLITINRGSMTYTYTKTSALFIINFLVHLKVSMVFLINNLKHKD